MLVSSSVKHCKKKKRKKKRGKQNRTDAKNVPGEGEAQRDFTKTLLVTGTHTLYFTLVYNAKQKAKKKSTRPAIMPDSIRVEGINTGME